MSIETSHSDVTYHTIYCCCVLPSCIFRKDIAEDLREIKREEGLAMMQSRTNMARASGVSVNDRRAKASYLRGILAGRQAKFLLANGNDQARFFFFFSVLTCVFVSFLLS